MGKVWDEMHSARIENLTHPTEPTSEREWFSSQISHVLKEAADTVNGPRQETYGSPHESFQQIAEFWDAYLKRRADGPIGPQDVANMMILMKVSRSATGGKHHDSTVDIIGYAALKEVI